MSHPNLCEIVFPKFIINPLCANRNKSRLLFSRLLKCVRSLFDAVCSGSKLFASILNSSVILGNYLQQTTSADDIFKCIFSWRFKSKSSTMIFNDTSGGHNVSILTGHKQRISQNLMVSYFPLN